MAQRATSSARILYVWHGRASEAGSEGDKTILLSLFQFVRLPLAGLLVISTVLPSAHDVWAGLVCQLQQSSKGKPGLQGHARAFQHVHWTGQNVSAGKKAEVDLCSYPAATALCLKSAVICLFLLHVCTCKSQVCMLEPKWAVVNLPSRRRVAAREYSLMLEPTRPCSSDVIRACPYM